MIRNLLGEDFMFSKLKVLLSGVIIFAGITVEAVPSYQKAETKNELLLFRAIEKENIGLVQRILDNFEEIENINAKIQEGMTPLHLAVEKKLLEIAALLLNKGADTNAVDHLDKTPLYIATLLGDLEMVSLLLNRGADPNKFVNNFETPLHLASRLCQKDIILHLLKEDSIEINIQQQATFSDGYGFYKATPLEISIEVSCEEGSLLLLENGAATEIDVFYRVQISDFHNLFKYGNVLSLAVKNESSDRVIEAIIKNSSPDIFNATDDHGNTILNISARKGGKTFHKLLEYYENINQPNDSGDTPLHSANNNEDVASALLKKQPSLACVENNKGKTPSHSILSAGMIKLLLEKGSGLSCIDKQDENGNTPLHLAANEDVVSALLKKQPSLACVENNKGETPFHSFLYYNRLAEAAAGMIKLLLEKGSGLSCIDKQDENDDAPLHIAAKEDKLETARILLEAGANVNAGANTYLFGLIQWGGKTPLNLPSLSDKMIKLLESY